MKQQRSGVGCAVVAVLVTLVVLWFLCQSTFGVISVPVPGIAPPAMVQPVQHVPSHAKR